MSQISQATIAQIAKYSGLVRLASTIATGAGEEIFVDGPKIPAGSVGVVTLIAQGHPSQMSETIGAFVCDATMGWNSSPLQNNGTLDPNKIGPLIGQDGSNIQNIGSISQFNAMIFLAENQFLRFATFKAPAVVPAAGDFATIRLAISTIPQCEVC